MKTANWYEPTQEALDAWAEWTAERPPAVREVAERFPPWTLWKLPHTDDPKRFQRVYVRSFGEPEDGTVTLTVCVDGRFNLLAFERNVFGIDPSRLEPCELPGPDEKVGSAGLNVEQAKSYMRATKRNEN